MAGVGRWKPGADGPGALVARSLVLSCVVDVVGDDVEHVIVIRRMMRYGRY